MGVRTFYRRLGVVSGMVVASMALTGCTNSPEPALVRELGDSLGRLRDVVTIGVERSRGPAHSIAPLTLIRNLKKSLGRVPDTFRLRAAMLPEASDLERLLAPPASGWQPAGLGKRLVARFRF